MLNYGAFGTLFAELDISGVGEQTSVGEMDTTDTGNGDEDGGGE